MKNLAMPLFILIFCLGVVWFARTNSETVDGWFGNMVQENIDFKNEINSVPEGSYYMVKKDTSSGSTKKITSGPIPEAKADDMFVHKGYTYVFIVPQNPTAIRYGLEGYKWYIYSVPTAGDEKPIRKIAGVEVVQETLDELMAKDQDHVIGDEK